MCNQAAIETAIAEDGLSRKKSWTKEKMDRLQELNKSSHFGLQHIPRRKKIIRFFANNCTPC